MRKRLLSPTGWALLLSGLFWGLLAGAAHYSYIDDMQWAIHIGVRWWKEAVLNSRYAGNLFAVLLCHFTWFRIPVMWLTMALIPYLMARLAVRDGKGTGSPSFLPAFLLCNAFLLLTPQPVWREVYGWVSGFGNYAVSLLFFLVWLAALRRVDRTRRSPRLWGAALFCLTLAMGLFLENLTLLFLGASLILALWAVWDRPVRIPFWACLAGAAAAVYFMFFNGIVLDLLRDGVSLGGRRALTFSPEDGPVRAVLIMLRRYLDHLMPMFFLHGPGIALPLAVLTGCAFWRGPLRKLSALALLPLLYSCWVWIGYNTVPSVLACCLCWALPLAALLLQEDSPRNKAGRVLLFLAAPLSLAPLAAIDILGDRFCFFPMALLALLAADEAAPLLTGRVCLPAAALLTAALAAPWVWRGSDVMACNLLRWSLTNQALAEGSAHLVLPTDRYDGLWWYPRGAVSAEGANYYAQRFGLPMDMTLVVLPAGSFECWPDVPPELWEARKELHPDEPFTPTMP